jgi:hypothetical protein
MTKGNHVTPTGKRKRTVTLEAMGFSGAMHGMETGG